MNAISLYLVHHVVTQKFIHVSKEQLAAFLAYDSIQKIEAMRVSSQLPST
jgi:hypothetical protein